MGGLVFLNSKEIEGKTFYFVWNQDRNEIVASFYDDATFGGEVEIAKDRLQAHSLEEALQSVHVLASKIQRVEKMQCACTS